MRPVSVGAVEIIGVSFATDGERASRTPIYSVVFGSPRVAEVRAFDWSSRFGMYGLDATLWTRESPDSQARWRRTVLRRPRTLEEMAAFNRAPEVFREEVTGAVDLLPRALRALRDAERAAIDYVVRFGSEGMRLALRVGVTADQAAALLSRVQQAIGVRDEGAWRTTAPGPWLPRADRFAGGAPCRDPDFDPDPEQSFSDFVTGDSLVSRVCPTAPPQSGPHDGY